MDFTLITDSAFSNDLTKQILVKDAAAAGVDLTKELGAKGFTCDAASIARLMANDAEYKAHVEAFAKDAGFSLGDENIDALAQFFYVWNEAEINRIYRGRTAVQTFGVKTIGDWLTEKIVFKTRELKTGKVGLYDDFSRPNYVSYNYGYDTRDTLRLEWGLEVTKREEAVAGVMRRNAYKDKKDAIILTQDIWENAFFWNGTTVGSKKLYGALNEVNLRAVTSLPASGGASIATPSTVTLEIVIATLRAFKQNIADDLVGNGDADSLPIKILCPLAWQQSFTATNTYMGFTGYKWLAENWKNVSLEFKPELTDKCIVYAQSVPGVGLDTYNLARTSALRLVGAMTTLKGREEAYSSSIAGALVACPLGVRIYQAA